MVQRFISIVLSLAVVFIGAETILAEQARKGCCKKVSVPGLVTVTATVRSAPPAWAVMERHLISTINEAAPEFLEKYSDIGGRMPQIGKPDDIYEDFGNWPLFYALGGDDSILEMSLRQWNAITRQLTNLGRLDREYVKTFDWFHQSETYKNFYYFGLANPAVKENIERSKRFAEMYTGEDPLAKNYDPKFKIMRSPVTGSTGPSFEQSCTSVTSGFASLYPFIKDEIVPGWENDKRTLEKYQKIYNRIGVSIDTPISLSTTALVANAYLYTGDEKYRKWILEYVDAWMERIRQNNGIIPDNIGPTGKIGENRNGQWWGALFGWSTRYSLHMMFGALTTATEAAYLITADPKYLDLLRSQLEVLLKNGRTENGQLLVPYRYGPGGWYDYRPLEIREASHLYNISMNTDDWKRIETLMNGFIYGPRPYDNYNDYAMPVTGHLTYKWASNGKRMDFTNVVSNGDIGDKMQEQEELNEAPRQLFLSGKNPDFPVKILQAELQEITRRQKLSRSIDDIYKTPHRHSEFIAGLNPVVVKGLVYLTMGGPAAIYNGGLLQIRVRYFDAEKARAGLPDDVAALVEKIEPNRTVVELVNISTMNSRHLIVQAGAYGEHEITEVKYFEQPVDDVSEKPQTSPVYEEKTVSVNKKFFAVELPPATSIKLDMGIRRYANKPSYAFPWHEQVVKK